MAENIVSPAVPLFQKAHARMVTLQRVDEQLVTLLEQRKRIIDELKSVQSQINDEFERVTSMDESAPEKILSTIADINRGSHAAQPAPRIEGGRTEREEALA
jgi:hypothetical protein